MRFGGLGIPNPCTLVSQHFETSKEMTVDIIASFRYNDELDAVIYRAHSTHVHHERKRSQKQFNSRTYLTQFLMLQSSLRL